MTMNSATSAPARSAFTRWWLEEIPLARIAVVRAISYLFILVDVFLSTSWVAAKAYAPSELYRSLTIGELFNLPTPGFAYVTAVKWVLVVAALVAATGYRPRISGTVVAICYLLWMVIAMSYGKVDHDRFAYLVLLAVLPTVGRARFGDQRRSERAGFAIQAVFVAVMLTYFLSALAKIRFGGWDWPTGATLTRAVLRRGTGLVQWTLAIPGFLMVAQWVMILGESLSPLMLLARSTKFRIFVVCGLLTFHVMTFLTIRIVFLPHCIAILALLPWERLGQDRTLVKVDQAQPQAAVS